jgi:uncharacterized protein (TIGR04255 family)
MKNWESFTNPPIQEAIFTIILSEDLISDQLERIVSNTYLKETFRNEIKQIYKTTAKIEQEDGEFKVFNSLKEADGFRFNSESRVLIVKQNQISLHIISGYKNWEFVVDELSKIIQEISTILDIKCTNIAVRFINNIKLPQPSVSLNDFFTLYISLPSGISQSFDNFFLTISVSKKDMKATIIETVDSRTHDNNQIGIILDIDVNKPLNKKLNLISIKDDFQELREYKNELFFNTITEKTKRELLSQ